MKSVFDIKIAVSALFYIQMEVDLMEFNLEDQLEHYRTRTITNIKSILNDPSQDMYYEDFRVLLNYMENASQMDLILALATQRLTTLQTDWTLEDSYLEQQ